MTSIAEQNGHVTGAEQRARDAFGTGFSTESLRVLAESAISPEDAVRFGIRAVRSKSHVPEEINPQWVRGNGLLFEWRDKDRTVIQYRPDLPVMDDDGNPHKYIFPGKCGTFLGHLREPATDDDPYLFVEGSKQGVAAAVWAPEGWGVVAVPGCQNWIGTDLTWAEGRDVVCLFDADVATNRDVWQAASGLKEALEAEGAETVRFAALAGAKSKEGLDDVLGRRAADKRTPYLERICKAAKKSLGRPPAKKQNEDAAELFDDKGSLLAQTAVSAVLDGQPAAIAAGSMVALYRDGRYVLDRGKEQLYAVVQEALGERYRPTWRSTIEEVILGRLAADDIRIPERMSEPLLNCKNGMLDLRTGKLLPHSPDYLSALQIPVKWDENAKAPVYEAWLRAAMDEMQALEESASTMLDASRTPGKALFLFGPSHTGKSTFLRLMKAVAGDANTAGVTLHQLSDDRFAAADIYQRMLNVAADLSSAHVNDLSVFKMLSGEDTVYANRKYGGTFNFTNQALFAFSANELPTVSESSDAYVNRMRPFHFNRTFAGKEDPTIEQRMMAELPGILVRWVDAWQAFTTRGRYLPTDPAVAREFATKSDRVAMWLDEKCDVHVEAIGSLVGPEAGSKKTELHQEFCRWAQEEDKSSQMSSRKFMTRLQSVPGVGEVRLRHANKNVGLNVTIRPEGGSVSLSPFVVAQRTTPDVEKLADPGMNRTPSGVGAADGSVGNDAHTEVTPLAETHSGNSDTKEQTGTRESAGVCGVWPTDPYSPCVRESKVIDHGSEGGHTQRHGQYGSEGHTPHTDHTPAENPGSVTLSEADAFLFGDSFAAAPLPEEDRTDAPSRDSLAPVSAEGGVSGLSARVGDLISSESYTGLAGFDIETGSARRLWDTSDPSFVRITSLGGVVEDGTGSLLARLEAGQTLVGHNVLSYDAIAVQRHTGIPVLNYAGQIRDIRLQGWLADPPTSAQTKTGPTFRSYSLDALADRVLGRSKDARGAALVKKFCTTPGCSHSKNAAACNGWDNIPKDHPDYQAYCAEDDLLALDIHNALPWTPYMEREMRVQAIMSRISINGFRVDTELLESRIAEGEAKKSAAVKELAERFDMPIERARTLKSGEIRTTELKTPLSTSEGKAWLAGLWERFGVARPPLTSNGGLSTSAESLDTIREHPKCPAELRHILGLMRTVTTSRTIYSTIADHLHGDRVNPSIWPSQASGRWSLTDPGLTVVGKRGALAGERDVFIGDEGEMIVCFDLGQADPRVMAAHSQDHAYLDLMEPGKDVHTEIAVQIFGDAKFRTQGKPISNGANYGMGANSLIKAGHDADLVHRFFQRRRELFPTLVKYTAEVVAMGQTGDIFHNGFGRPMRVERDHAYTQAPAQIGQSGTRDLVAQGLLDLQDRAPEVLPMLRGVVHDELVLSIPVADVEEVSRTVVSCLERVWAPEGCSRPVPIVSDATAPGRSWGESYRLKKD